MPSYPSDLSVQSHISALDGSIESRGFCSPHHFSENEDSPEEYIRSVRKELAETPESFSYLQLEAITLRLKKAYALCRHKKDKSLLSEYRSSLARIGMQKARLEMVGAKNLDEIMADSETDAYQKFILARTWLLRQSYPRLYNPQTQELIDRTYQKVHSLLEEKAQEGSALTLGEQRAHTRLMDELETVESGIKKIILPNFIRPLKTKEPELPVSFPVAQKKTIFQNIGSCLSKSVFGLTLLVGIGAAAISSSFQTENPYYFPVSQVRASVMESVNYSIDSLPNPVQKPLSQLKVQKSRLQIPLPGTHIIREGDILWSLAERYYGDPWRWPALAEANGVEDPHGLQIGDILVLQNL